MTRFKGQRGAHPGGFFIRGDTVFQQTIDSTLFFFFLVLSKWGFCLGAKIKQKKFVSLWIPLCFRPLELKGKWDLMS